MGGGGGEESVRVCVYVRGCARETEPSGRRNKVVLIRSFSGIIVRMRRLQDD